MHPALKAKSKFKWSSSLRDLNAAQLWGVDDPDTFENLSKRAKIKVIAWYEIKWRVEAISAYDNAEKQRLEAEHRKLKK